MKYEFKKIAHLDEPRRLIQWLAFNQQKRDNFIVLFENMDSIFIAQALEDEFGIKCLDSCSTHSGAKCVGYLIRPEDANLLRLMRPEKLVLCEEVGVIIDHYNKFPIQ